MRKKINQVLKPFGYQLTKVDKFKELLYQEYKKSRNFRFIQVGANDGVSFDDLFSFVSTRKSSGIVIEPLKYYYDLLQKNYSAYPDIIPLNCALHDRRTRCALHYVDPMRAKHLPDWMRGIGSVFPEHHKKLGTPSSAIKVEEVDCKHFMEVVHEYNFYDISLLQIDVEGYDFEVLKMIDFDIVVPSIIKYEHSALSDEDKERSKLLLNIHGYRVIKQGPDYIAYQ